MKTKHKKCLCDILFNTTFQVILMLCWVAIMLYSKAFVLIYVLFVTAGFLCMLFADKSKRKIFAKTERTNLIISAVISLTIIIFNYDIAVFMLKTMVARHEYGNKLRNNIDLFSRPLFCILFPILLIGGTYIFYFILNYFSDNEVRLSWKSRIRNLLHSDKFLSGAKETGKKDLKIKDRIMEILKKIFLSTTFQIVTMFCWIAVMLYTRAFVLIYVLLAIAGFLCMLVIYKQKRNLFEKTERPNLIIAALFSFVLLLANYSITTLMLQSIFTNTKSGYSIDRYSGPLSYILFPFLFIGGTYIVYYVLKYLSEKTVGFSWNVSVYKMKPHVFFIASFLLFSLFYSMIMLLCFYPGSATTDSYNQISQVLSGHYSNHHPYYHTMIIRLCINIGKLMTDDLNVGVMLYSLVSIVFVSLAYSYCLVTLYQLKIDKKIVAAVAMLYLLLPEHIAYSFAMWKDVPFSVSVLIFTVAAFRYIQKVGKHRNLDFAIFIMSMVGICLFRNNGLIAMIISLAAFVLLIGKSNKKVIIGMAAVLAVCFILKTPVLNAIGVAKTEPVESLSIPIQQIARTVVDNDDLTDDEKELISKAIDIQLIPKLYSPNISDPVKFYINDHGDQDYMRQHKWDYALLYIKLGLKHPKSYMAAWVDQTDGFWNVCTSYSRYPLGCKNTKLGLYEIVFSPMMRKAVMAYFIPYYYLDFLKMLYNVGLYTWGILLVAYISYRKKDRLTTFLTIPCLSVVATLLIATPVSNEMRYAYALLCCLPFLAVIVFRKETLVNDKEKNSNE